MESLTIHFKESIKEKLLNMLHSFSENDLKISENEHFEELKSFIREDYTNYKIGISKLLDIEDVEKEMNQIISDNEDRNNR